jgi:heparanase 1
MIPLPDYWSSLIWKKLMGREVYSIKTDDTNPYVRVYAHKTPGSAGFPADSITMLVINLHKDETTSILLPETGFSQETVYSLSADNIYGSDIRLNGMLLSCDSGNIPDILAAGKLRRSEKKELDIAPTSFKFVVLHN